MNNLISVKNLPSLEQATESLISLTPIYLDVDEMQAGDKFRGFYIGISTREHEVENKSTGELETKTLETVQIVNKEGDEFITYESAASMLVSTLKQQEESGKIKPYETALVFKFLGKKRNKTNANSSARWDVRILEFNRG